MKIKKPYDPVVCRVAPHGDDVEIQYQLSRDANGNSIYTEKGKRDIRSYVASFEAGASLQAMLDRCSLMPVQERIAYLQQNQDGFSVDLTSMPKDGTEAQIMLAKINAVCPDFGARLRKGESFESLLAEYFPNKAETAKSEPEKEVTDNGT